MIRCVFLVATCILMAQSWTLPDVLKTAKYVHDGTEARPNQYPYIVVLYLKHYGTWTAFCGGTLVKKNKVLTAGHCLERYDKWTPHYVGLGFHNFTLDVEDPTKQKIEFKSAVAPAGHDPRANVRDLINDIAVITLERDAVLSDTVKLVTLSRKSKTDIMGLTGWAAGWGYWSNGALTVAPSQKVSPDSSCIILRKIELQSYQMCVKNSGSEVCKGDSGGPLMIGGEQVGVVSWGPNCGRDLGGVYTSVGAFWDFISSNL